MKIHLTDDRSLVDEARVVSFLQETVWQSHIGPRTLQRALEISICMSAFEGEQQVGFARAVSDRATFCWIDDVFVDRRYRGRGIASQLIEALLKHEELRSVATWFLSSGNPDARRVFTRHGFAPLPDERLSKLMALPKAHNVYYHS